MHTKDRYTDIFDEPFDASFEQDLAQMAALYGAHEPPAQLSWARLQLQLRKKELVSSKQQKMALNWMHPTSREPRRLVLVASLLLSLLLLSGFAYATFNLGVLDTLFHAEPASQHLLQTKQFTTLQQSQVIDGYTVTLEKGYADANRIIVGFIVTYPHGIDPKTWNTSFVGSGREVVNLKTSSGQSLSLLGTTNGLDGGNPKAAKEGIAMAFDGATIQGKPARLPLNLTLGAECGLVNSQYGCKQTLTYNFTLPFHQGRVLNLHQTVTANGHRLTLERVVVTPSEARVYVRWLKGDLEQPAFVLPGGPAGPATYTQPVYDLQLSAGGQTYPICEVSGGLPCRVGFGPGSFSETASSFVDKGGSFFEPGRLDSQTVGFSLFQPLSNQHGTWTLTITKMDMPMKKVTQDGHVGYESTSSPSKDSSAQPWTFTFNAQ
ncbi:DUF4179 domain-containing protein [Ktedonobacter robiniae]|uniref:DUF4179 domain-containing protein n=1 Tax=Ktedonobacter robiniae TaxID=2778365 RepID=A0ABQ3UUC2_9CHLR|nr:DUF4179 domain-containing protein [Ktedonobacter robiniae]GHO56353.1 hypothetical protein KSB_48280 [Ktedonobacter robiniae]